MGVWSKAILVTWYFSMISYKNHVILDIICTCVFVMSLYMFYECVEQLHFDSFSQVQ